MNMFEKFREKLALRKGEIPKYGLLYFDHLRGEFLLEETEINDREKQICLDIENKGKDKTLTWNDIYAYQLILLKYQDFETLKSKIISLRVKYQNLVDIAEYNSYVALRALDLTQPVGEADIEKLRADYKYLLDEFYLRYAYVSTREELRTKLLRYGALLTLSFFLLAAVVGALAGLRQTRTVEVIYLKETFSTIFIVACAGIVGAFVSMQQRLQAMSHEGDPIYNLSLLTHGWFSIFLSPISGAIFAVILYLFFAGGFLSGEIFPAMTTAAKPETLINSFGETRQTAPANPDAPTSSGAVADAQTNAPTIQSTEEPTMGLTNFLSQTGPSDGKAFALLIIWSFIAGFAERFVPDTLMRLVNQKKANETGTA